MRASVLRTLPLCVFATLLKAVVVNGCTLQGTDSGICMNFDDALKLELPFCGEVINYRVCVPQYKGAVVSRWRNHTIFGKDQWVESQFNREWNIRKVAEENETLKRLGVDERGLPGQVVQRFYGGDEAAGDEDPWLVMNDCAKAYKNFFCWANFPRCDDADESMLMCRSACVNYFKSCGYPKDMERCGPTEFLNGYEPEKPTQDDNGLYSLYFRSFFPGQPFQDNEFEQDGVTPIAVCTPSIKNSASKNDSGIGIPQLLATLCFGWLWSTVY